MIYSLLSVLTVVYYSAFSVEVWDVAHGLKISTCIIKMNVEPFFFQFSNIVFLLIVKAIRTVIMSLEWAYETQIIFSRYFGAKKFTNPFILLHHFNLT